MADSKPASSQRASKRHTRPADDYQEASRTTKDNEHARLYGPYEERGRRRRNGLGPPTPRCYSDEIHMGSRIYSFHGDLDDTMYQLRSKLHAQLLESPEERAIRRAQEKMLEEEEARMECEILDALSRAERCDLERLRLKTPRKRQSDTEAKQTVDRGSKQHGAQRGTRVAEPLSPAMVTISSKRRRAVSFVEPPSPLPRTSYRKPTSETYPVSRLPPGFTPVRRPIRNEPDFPPEALATEKRPVQERPSRPRLLFPSCVIEQRLAESTAHAFRLNWELLREVAGIATDTIDPSTSETTIPAGSHSIPTCSCSSSSDNSSETDGATVDTISTAPTSFPSSPCPSCAGPPLVVGSAPSASPQRPRPRTRPRSNTMPLSSGECPLDKVRQELEHECAIAAANEARAFEEAQKESLRRFQEQLEAKRQRDDEERRLAKEERLKERQRLSEERQRELAAAESLLNKCIKSLATLQQAAGRWNTASAYVESMNSAEPMSAPVYVEALSEKQDVERPEPITDDDVLPPGYRVRPGDVKNLFPTIEEVITTPIVYVPFSDPPPPPPPPPPRSSTPLNFVPLPRSHRDRERPIGNPVFLLRTAIENDLKRRQIPTWQSEVACLGDEGEKVLGYGSKCWPPGQTNLRYVRVPGRLSWARSHKEVWG